MKQKIAIIGANGQLGTDLVKVFKADQEVSLIPLTHHDIEITSTESVRSVFDKINPTIIINTAAFHKVDDCETNIKQAFGINAVAEKNLADYCNSNDIALTYISTDYVFGLDHTRETPYIESDAPGPLNVYALSKLTGEYYTRYILKKHFIVRSCGLYGLTESSVKGGNFVNTMLKFAQEKDMIQVVDDQIVTPTHTKDLALQIHKLLKTDNFGLYHATSQGECSWYEFAKEIFRLTGKNVRLIPVSSSQYKTPARRPHYTVLENAALKSLQLDILPDWKEGLKNYLIEKGLL